MALYEILVNTLDKLCKEAPLEYKSYHPLPTQTEQLNAARSKSLLHLYLKVSFGLLDFLDRESFITEGANDGGVDAYYIDREHRVIYFLQAKFRTSEKNFEAKSIEPEELLMMDISRILDGETISPQGVEYNSKVLKMAKSIKEIDDIGRYKYKVVILANAKGVTKQKLNQLTGDLPTELVDYKDCYSRLLFPLISGTYYNAEQLRLSLNLGGKTPGAKISYTVSTELTECEITLVFVPTIEIARTMFKYRNSILQYNPRSYLGHEGRSVNAAIRQSIEMKKTNEFALFNNGITILSDETYVNERIGHKGRAQLVLVNPQIINGGQTAYTLSIIYRENQEKDTLNIFDGKEVLVKIITFEGGANLSELEKLTLIEDISRATNQQTAVTNADRRSNETEIKLIQKRLFDYHGLLVERKKGEFSDGVKEGYIKDTEIIDRNLFFRAIMVAQGRIKDASAKKITIKAEFGEVLNLPEEFFEKASFALRLIQELTSQGNRFPLRITNGLLCVVYFGIHIGFKPGMRSQERDKAAKATANVAEEMWKNFAAQYGKGILHINYPMRQKNLIAGTEEYLNSDDFQTELEIFITSLTSISTSATENT